MASLAVGLKSGTNAVLNSRSWGESRSPALVLLHGFMGASGDWEPVTRRLRSEYRVLAIDLPGHGSSLGRPAPDYTISGAVAAIVKTIEAQGIADGYGLAGYSMGGRMSLHIARAHPASVAGLCLVSAHTGLEGEKARRDRRDGDRRLADSLVRDTSRFMEDWFSLPMFASMPPDLADAIKEARIRSGNPLELARALQGLSVGGQDDFRDWFLKAPLPRRFLVGEHDDKYVELARTLSSDLVGLETRIVANAGHNLVAEAPRSLEDELIGFMGGLG